jgi:HPt (histidine-containing phosphotransfer) domain-containing protein
MFELTETVIRQVVAPPLVPVGRPIDADHLSRMTLGDRALENEVLALFREQSALLRARMDTGAPDVTGAAAHTLKGSARGIGAWSVAQMAAEAEEAARTGATDALAAALQGLDAALGAALLEIEDLLAAR